MPAERTVSRFTFWLLVFVTMLGMTIVPLLFVATISRRLGFQGDPFPALLSFVGTFSVFFSRVVVDRGLKAVGLSRSSQMVEARRPALTSSRCTPVEDVVEIHYSRSLSNGLVLICLEVVAVIFILFEVVIAKHDQQGREFLPVLYGMFLAGATFSYLLRHTKIMRIDARGVTAGRKQFSIGRTLVPWSQIASCDLVEVRDTFGKVAVAYPVLRDF